MPAMQRYARHRLSDGRIVFARYEAEGATELLDKAPWLGGRPVGTLDPRSAPLCPVEPSKILCIGRNYADHAREMGAELPDHPLLFLKPPSSLLHPEGTVILPPESSRVEHEGELGVVIGRRARRVSVAEAMDYVFGYTIVADITARDLQRKDGQWSRAKGFDTFCPVGPWVVTGVEPGNLDIRVFVDDQERQRGNTSQMIFGVPELVSFLSQAMTLMPGDLIATGTPPGVGPLLDGQTLRIEIEQLGVLRVAAKRETNGRGYHV